MSLTSFCGLLTLQVGAAILAAVFFALAGAILAANAFDYHNEYSWFPYSFILMIIFVIGLVITGAFMFASSYKESRSLAIISVVVIVILICYWLILCAFSFLSNPDHVRGVCINTRCPETFWLGSLGYRRQHLEEEGTTPVPVTYWWGKPTTTKIFNRILPKYLPTTSQEMRRKKRMEPSVTLRSDTPKYRNIDRTNPFEPQGETVGEQKTIEEYEEKIKNHQVDVENKEGLDYVNNINRENNIANGKSSNLHQYMRWIGENLEFRDNTHTTLSTTNNTSEEKPSRYVFGSAMIGAIILFIINLLFLLFSAFVMYSWAQELSWEDYYYYYYDDDDSMEI